MATKTKKQSKAKVKSPHNAKSSDRRRTIESRDLNEDEQNQVTNSSAEEEGIADFQVQNSNFTVHDERDDDMAKESRERQDQIQEDDKEHKGEEQL